MGKSYSKVLPSNKHSRFLLEDGNFGNKKVSDHSIKCVKPHESGRMIACGSANGSVHLMEVSENMTYSAKNDKAILNAMLDRESKREKILEGKLREIKIKLKKQQEEEARAAELLLRQAENATENIKVDEAKVKPSLAQTLIEAAENEFNLVVEEEIQRRIQDMNGHDHENGQNVSETVEVEA